MAKEQNDNKEIALLNSVTSDKLVEMTTDLRSKPLLELFSNNLFPARALHYFKPVRF